jgi:hypothetical protein
MMGGEHVQSRAIQFVVRAFAVAVLAFGASLSVRAQDADGAQPAPEHDHHHMAADSSTWTWSTDASVIAGYNYQDRKFADFWAWESQNWIMAMGQRQVGSGTLMLNGMFSLEPWTIGRLVYAHGQDGPERIYAFDNTGHQQPVGARPSRRARVTSAHR